MIAWRRRPPGKENSCKYTKKAVTDSQKEVVLEPGAGRVAGKFLTQSTSVLQNVTQDTDLVRIVHYSAVWKMFQICMQSKVLLSPHEVF